MAPAFELFGFDHLAALACTASVAAAGILLARRGHERTVRLTMAALLVMALAGYLAGAIIEWRPAWYHLLPLELCYAAVLVTIVALATRWWRAAELTWYFGLTAELLAMVTPTVDAGFPHWHFVTYFALHGLVVAAAFVLPFGSGVGPRPGGPWRAWLALNLMALVVGIIDVAAGLNYMWLRRPPATATLLDSLGPWPVYIFVCNALAAVLFWVLGRPFRGAARPRPEAP